MTSVMLGPVVQRMDRAVLWIKLMIAKPVWCYPLFEQLGHGEML